MAMCIIDLLEMVDIKHEYPGRATFDPGTRHFARQQFFKSAPVPDPGQAVDHHVAMCCIQIGQKLSLAAFAIAKGKNRFDPMGKVLERFDLAFGKIAGF